MTKRIVALTGAGISAESGLRTFRDSDGLWEGYDVTEVATPEAWKRDPALVQKFYNERRSAVRRAEPNAGHYALVELEQHFDVQIVTQNIDDLHERAGSTNVHHLHGEVLKSRSSVDEDLIYDVQGDNIEMGELCERGSQLRPHIVWFGEAVPMMESAARIAATADLFLVVGTSLVVYPAAGLVDFVPSESPVFVVDPGEPMLSLSLRARGDGLTFIQKTASVGMPELVKKLVAASA